MVVYKNLHIGDKLDMVYVKSDDAKKIRLEDSEELVDEAIFPVADNLHYIETDVPIDALKDEAPEVVEAVFGNYITAARATELAPVINAAVLEVQTDEDAVVTPELYPKWSGEGVSYVTDQRVRYNGILYKVSSSLTPHSRTGHRMPQYRCSPVSSIPIRKSSRYGNSLIQRIRT